MKEQSCDERVYGSDRGFRGSPCQKKGRIQEGDKWFCVMHSTEGKKKRHEKLRAKWDEQTKLRNAKYDQEREQQKRDSALRAFCEGVDTETIVTMTASGKTLPKWMAES